MYVYFLKIVTVRVHAGDGDDVLNELPRIRAMFLNWYRVRS